MSSLFTLNTYARGEEDGRNLLPDTDFFSGGDLPVDTSTNGTYAEQWYVAGSTLGTGGDYAAVIDDTFGRTGTNSLRLSLSTTGAPGNSVQVMSPHVDVEPGETYLFTGWAGKTENTTARSYFRIAGGSDDTLTEYVASQNTNDIDGHITYEDKDLPDIDTGSGPDATLMVRRTVIATIPAGITRAAIRVINWQPTSGSTHYWDDFGIYKLTGEGAYTGDTGRIELALINNWVDYGTVYGIPAIQMKNGWIKMTGLVKDGTTAICTVLPECLRPEYYQISSTQTSGPATVRLDVSAATGEVSFGGGYTATWTSLNAAPWIMKES